MVADSRPTIEFDRRIQAVTSEFTFERLISGDEFLIVLSRERLYRYEVRIQDLAPFRHDRAEETLLPPPTIPASRGRWRLYFFKLSIGPSASSSPCCSRTNGSGGEKLIAEGSWASTVRGHWICLNARRQAPQRKTAKRTCGTSEATMSFGLTASPRKPQPTTGKNTTSTRI